MTCIWKCPQAGCPMRLLAVYPPPLLEHQVKYG
jgi:hypothetical protein